MTAGDAIASWLGALTDGGVLSASATAGRAIAAYVLGEDSLRRLRSSFERLTPEQARAEKIAVLETCLWMACSDRFVAPEEKTLLLEMIRSSGLSPDDQEMLEIEIGTRPPLVDLDHRLQIYELREMLLAMCWELAIADGRIDPMETGFFQEIRQRLEIDAERARDIQDAVGGQLVD
jgi:tellurite resistance protein